MLECEMKYTQDLWQNVTIDVEAQGVVQGCICLLRYLRDTRDRAYSPRAIFISITSLYLSGLPLERLNR